MPDNAHVPGPYPPSSTDPPRPDPLPGGQPRYQQPRYEQPTLGGPLADGDADPRTLPLRDATFVVLDLETTGGTAADGGVTEIGAVKIRGGQRLGTFATLVDPGLPIPPLVTVLTGITTAMVSAAPRLPAVLPGLLEFLRGAVVVAHNAPYDLGYLRAACTRHGYAWPSPPVLDTLPLSRRVFTRDEVPDRKLGTLARYLRLPHQPTHRALADAEATVDLLHALCERLGGFGVDTVGGAIAFGRAVSPVRQRQRHLADGLPRAPGVYLFRAADDRPLYVGTSRDIAGRVRTYFTAAERRPRVDEMLAAAVRVEAVVCAHALEAEVRELRLIAAHAPPYNRRSKHPQRTVWLRVTDEPYPRLSVVRQRRGTPDSCLGPFPSTRAAERVAEAVREALPLRPCAQRLSARTPSAACALAELGRCPAPCLHRVTPEQYAAAAVAPLREATVGDPGPLVEVLLARIATLSAAQRYEEAAAVRGRLSALLRATTRLQRLAAVTGIAELVAAHPAAGGGWELAVVRYGRLAAAGGSPPRVHPQPTIDLLLATAETVEPGDGPVPAATAEETERILHWLERPRTRLVRVSTPWALPARGAARFAALLAQAEVASRSADAS
ncbi:DNA polymerase III subunit epsilon [Pilimelia anulata]|uniref:DNA polymerase III subunit epsilon n=1 Tax=Pilimelia anulata TaxID=53371 RepID=A0A8J3B846_9ACTN|nr:DEDD exonuclease domain-containing protein [Pilimelia anulata]GGJ85060.1 DNA polymerase III subunit epsilon [Pilimelia anulata]